MTYSKSFSSLNPLLLRGLKESWGDIARTLPLGLIACGLALIGAWRGGIRLITEGLIKMMQVAIDVGAGHRWEYAHHQHEDKVPFSQAITLHALPYPSSLAVTCRMRRLSCCIDASPLRMG